MNFGRVKLLKKIEFSDPQNIHFYHILNAFWRPKFFFIFQLFVYNFLNKLKPSQKHFGIANIGSKMHIFRDVAI